jgi:hypothetical protein
MKVNLNELKRLREQVEGLFPPPPSDPIDFAGMGEEEWLDYLATHLPDYFRTLITGSREYARTLEGFDGPLSKAPGFKPAFAQYWESQYQGYAVNSGQMWLFVPGEPGTRYEASRQEVVRLMREQLLATGGRLDAKIASTLCDAALAELGRRWPRAMVKNKRVGVLP